MFPLVGVDHISRVIPPLWTSQIFQEWMVLMVIDTESIISILGPQQIWVLVATAADNSDDLGPECSTRGQCEARTHNHIWDTDNPAFCSPILFDDSCNNDILSWDDHHWEYHQIKWVLSCELQSFEQWTTEVSFIGSNLSHSMIRSKKHFCSSQDMIWSVSTSNNIYTDCSFWCPAFAAS